MGAAYQKAARYARLHGVGLKEAAAVLAGMGGLHPDEVEEVYGIAERQEREKKEAAAK